VLGKSNAGHLMSLLTAGVLHVIYSCETRCLGTYVCFFCESFHRNASLIFFICNIHKHNVTQKRGNKLSEGNGCQYSLQSVFCPGWGLGWGCGLQVSLSRFRQRAHSSPLVAHKLPKLRTFYRIGKTLARRQLLELIKIQNGHKGDGGQSNPNPNPWLNPNRMCVCVRWGSVYGVFHGFLRAVFPLIVLLRLALPSNTLPQCISCL